MTQEEIDTLIAERDTLKAEVLLCAKTGKSIIVKLGLDKMNEQNGSLRPVISCIGDIMQKAMMNPASLEKDFAFISQIEPIIAKYKNQI